jgi:uncharacterized protein
VRPFRLLFFLLLLAARVSALEVPPTPDHWFTDRAGLVTAEQAAQLDKKLQHFEQTSGAQFIIYVFPSLEGEPMEDFTIRCVEKWKVGQKKYDNGLVLFVFARDKKVRVEVAYGLEGTVTDLFSGALIRDVIAPRFQANDYFGGLNAAADAVIAKISKGEDPVAPMQRGSGRAQGKEINPIFVLAILFVVFFVILPMLSRRRGRSGGCGGCFPLFFFPGGGSGITFGGGGGGFGGGGFGGGGGFSGGGGSFGGGGASGGW